MKMVLAVCIGNICRSPLVQVALAKALQGLPPFQVISAGLFAQAGRPADPLAQQIAREQGLDLSQHRAQLTDQWLCQQADLILVMELSHKDLLEQQFPAVCGKVFRLGHFEGFDVRDPYGQPRAAFDTAWQAIARSVTAWTPRIRQL